ncbi:MAG: HPr(Ser) kinase/phosphatase [Lachnospiraceae bacterium]
MYKVSLTKIINKMELKNCTPEINTDLIKVDTYEVNRPALQLTGFYDNFENHRVQILGYVEHLYLEKVRMDQPEKLPEIYEKLFSSNIPCLIMCTELEPSELMLEIANKHGVPVLTSPRRTSEFEAEIIRWLKVELAPRISIHGVLVDVYGEGILIMGESGIGKSEAALELIKRGHRLVSDDVVEIKKVSEETLIGSSPDITRHFIELRGIGIIDVKTLFGVESVKMTQQINLVIRLEEWQKGKEYDRMGLEEQYIEFLGNKVVCHSIPIRPGRNLAIIVESAAVNYRTKKMGYNAAQELYNRVTGNMQRNMEQDD